MYHITKRIYNIIKRRIINRMNSNSRIINDSKLTFLTINDGGSIGKNMMGNMEFYIIVLPAGILS